MGLSGNHNSGKMGLGTKALRVEANDKKDAKESGCCK
jgi:hypothetical protein